MAREECPVGVVGLGVMGRNFALNMADHGFPVAVYNRTHEGTLQFMEEVGGRRIRPGYTPAEFLACLRRPRAVIFMVPAGPAVDSVINQFRPLLAAGDLLIDSGNSHFSDTDRRMESLDAEEILFMGMGISGGESGARHGPSLMPGGPVEGFERIRPILEAVAAHVDGDACVTHLGPGSAGHYVKMVHNGIEYGLQQLIAETYDLMRRGLGLNNDDLHEVYARWNRDELASYLIGITADIFRRTDERTGGRLVDVILDVARQKGTGMWTSRDAMDLRVPVPTIDLAVSMRCLSEMRGERRRAAGNLPGPPLRPAVDRDECIKKIENSLFAAFLITYAQGLSLLRRASDARGYGLDLEAVARIWRGGCIIRAALLEDLRAAFQEDPSLPSILHDSRIGREVSIRLGDLRRLVSMAVQWGIPVPALMTSLAYFDAFRTERLPANLIQAQRDYFGAHTYERLDADGSFHTEWQVK